MTNTLVLVAPRAPGNYDADRVSKASGLSCPLAESRTVQANKDDADINVIIQRFGLTGELPLSRRSPLPEGHYDEIEYRQALDQIKAADLAFSSLPATVRSRFDNDPAKFLGYVETASPEELAKLLPAESAGATQAPAPAPAAPSGGSASV